MGRNYRPLLGILAIAAILAIAVCAIWGLVRLTIWLWPTRPVGPGGGVPQSRPAQVPATATAPATAPANGKDELSEAQAQQAFGTGMAMLKDGKLLAARTLLSKALFSGRLSAKQEGDARAALTDLAEKTILSGSALDGDPYVFRYTFQPGNVINRVERKLELHVPPQFVLRINGIADSSKIRAGQTVTMVQGPFHAIVTKSKFTLDLYLHRQESSPSQSQPASRLPKIFVKRLRVGLGKDDTTPVGLWRVALGKKLFRAPWNPPANSPLRQTILWDEAGYPLGKEGYWISLEGIDDRTRGEEAYGIHGTNDPSSIGKAESLGCIRLADADIDLVFSMLYEKWSTVEVRP